MSTRDSKGEISAVHGSTIAVESQRRVRDTRYEESRSFEGESGLFLNMMDVIKYYKGVMSYRGDHKCFKLLYNGYYTGSKLEQYLWQL